MTKHKKETQYEKFVRVSRELETDESEDAFDKIVKRVAKAPTPKDDNKGKQEK